MYREKRDYTTIGFFVVLLSVLTYAFVTNVGKAQAESVVQKQCVEKWSAEDGYLGKTCSNDGQAPEPAAAPPPPPPPKKKAKVVLLSNVMAKTTIIVDDETGCQYIRLEDGSGMGLSPRLDDTGAPMCRNTGRK